MARVPTVVKRIAFIPLLLVLVFIPAASAQAAEGWSTPRSVGTAEAGATNAQAAADAQDRIVVAWERHSPSFNAIRVATESSESEFDDTQTLSSGEESSLRLAGVAVDDAGDAIVVWCSRIANAPVIRIAERPANGAFSPTRTLAPALPQSCADVDMNPRGDAAIAWTVENGVGLVTRLASGSFGQPVLAPGAVIPSATPSIAVDPLGATRVAWAGPISATSFRLWSAQRSVGGPVGATEPVSPDYAYDGSDMRVDLSRDGYVDAAWHGQDPQSTIRAILAAQGKVGTDLGPARAVTVDGAGTFVGKLSISAAPAGGMLLGAAAARERSGSCPEHSSFAAGFPSGRVPFLPFREESESVTSRATQMSVTHDDSGRGFVAWQEIRVDKLGCPVTIPAQSTVRAIAGAAGSTLDHVEDVSDPRYPVTGLALSQSGRATAAWRCFDGRKDRIQVSVWSPSAGQPLLCGAEDLDAPRVKLKTRRFPLRWRRSSKPSPRASCDEQCTATVGLLMFSRGHRAAKLGVSEQVLKVGKTRRLDFPKLGRGARRLVSRTVKRRSNVRFVYRLLFTDLAGNSRLRTARVRLF